MAGGFRSMMAFWMGGISSNPSTPAAIIGGHFIPHPNKKKHTISNVQIVYDKAKTLPRKATKELRDAVAEFVPPEAARIATVPDIYKVDYEALKANEQAYDKFLKALANIEKQFDLIEQQRIVNNKKLQDEDDELLLIAFIACTIH